MRLLSQFLNPSLLLRRVCEIISNPNLSQDRVDETASLYHPLPRQCFFPCRCSFTYRGNSSGSTPLRSSYDVQIQSFRIYFTQCLPALIWVCNGPILQSLTSRSCGTSRVCKCGSTPTQQSRKGPLSRAVVSTSGNIFVHDVWNIRKVADTPLRNAHVLEYRAVLCLIHIVQADVIRAAIPSVLPSKVDDWTGKPDIAVDLRCPVVLGCCLLVRADELGKVGDGVECENTL